MVIPKPMEVTKVSAVPFNSAGTDCATRAENWGESAITKKLHVKRNRRNKMGAAVSSTGLNKQQAPDTNNETEATFKLPHFLERIPPITQLTAPMPIIKNDQKGISS